MSILIDQIQGLLWKNWIGTKRSSYWAIIKVVYVGCLLACSFLKVVHDTDWLKEATHHAPSPTMLYGLFISFVVAAIMLLMTEMVSKIMIEKENRIREHLRIQGVSEVALAVSRIAYYIIVAIACSLPFITIGIYNSSYRIELMVLLHLFAASAVSYLVTSLADAPKVAQCLVPFTYLLPCAPAISVVVMRLIPESFTASTTDVIQIVASIVRVLHPGAALLDSADTMFYQGLDRIGSIDLLLPFLHLIGYTFVAMYCHVVIPSRYGSSRRWNFFLSGSEAAGATSRAPEQPLDPARFEGVHTPTRPAGVQIHRARKEFCQGSLIAVNDVSFDVFEGEIYTLLGHNGAGKTTLLECISGMQALSSGRIVLNGCDIADEPDLARQTLGVCPQFDALIPWMTPMETLQLAGRLKGLSSAASRSMAHAVLEKMGMLGRMNSMNRTLSGGQRRKVSVAIPFASNPKTVFLDEPTSGMDTESSLQFWSVLRSMKEGCSIILTTHNMAEAEALGNRIGIMSAGSLQCSGTASFLKNRLGSGYGLAVKVNHEDRLAEVVSMTRSIIPTASAVPSSSSCQIVFQFDNIGIAKLKDVLNTIDASGSDLGIVDYALIPSSLENVFLRIVREHGTKDSNTVQPLPIYTTSDPSMSAQISSMIALLWQHFLHDSYFSVSLPLPTLFLIVAVWYGSTVLFFLSFAAIIIACFPFSCSNVVTFHKCGLRAQLNMLGVSATLYWSMMLIWNTILLLFPAMCLCFIGPGPVVPTAVGFLSYFLLVPATVTFVSFIVRLQNHRTALALSLGSFFYTCFYQEPQGIMTWIGIYLARAIPSTNYLYTLTQTNNPARDSPTDFMVVVYPILLTVVYGGLILLIDFLHLNPNASWIRSRTAQLETGRVKDADVIAEADRVRSKTNVDLLKVDDLVKVYGKTVAVQGITIGVEGGSSLAFLGVNGSGKSSSIRCMLGLSALTGGRIHIAGEDVASDSRKSRAQIAYVPQDDGLLVANMTGRDHLFMFASLCGISADVQARVVSTLLSNTGLESAAGRKVSTYSGGMKRMLLVALALIMRRRVVIMDEPSTGVDPVSRRRMWQMFKEISSDPDRCLLLTTHYLDEAESVCDRISIMVNGEVMCLGDASHLKNKFGVHHQVDIYLADMNDIGTVERWMQTAYPTLIIAGQDNCHIRFLIPKNKGPTLAQLFSFVHSSHGMPIVEATVGDVSMEQIFLSIAHNARSDPNQHSVQILPMM